MENMDKGGNTTQVTITAPDMLVQKWVPQKSIEKRYQ